MAGEDKPPPQQTIQVQQEGRVLSLINAVKGLTVTNALVIIMLVIVAIPSYVAYRAINDENLLDRFLSEYREFSSQQSGCTLRVARVRGGQELWALSTGFAYQASDRYVLSVVIGYRPNAEQEFSYCETLRLIVDFMRDPDAKSPSFPNSDEPIIRQYKLETSRGP